MPTQLCRHIRTNGTRCGALALRGQPLCYYHHRMDSLHTSPEPALLPADPPPHGSLLAEYFAPAQLPLQLPPLEDRESIQLSLSMVIAAMAQNRIDLKLATALLYGLQIASTNAARLPLVANAEPIVRDTVTGDRGQQLALDEDPVPDPAEEGPLDSLLRKLERLKIDPDRLAAYLAPRPGSPRLATEPSPLHPESPAEPSFQAPAEPLSEVEAEPLYSSP